VDGLQVDGRFLLDGQEKVLVLAVLEEQVLGVAAGDLASQSLRIGNCIERRVGNRRHRDVESGEEGEEVVGRYRHGRSGCCVRLPLCRGRRWKQVPGRRSLRTGSLRRKA